MLYQLVCLQGSLAGHVVILDNETISFGRQAGAPLTITNTPASQQHAELRCEKGGYTLHDLQSQHGTFINGNRITSQTLRVGDLIDIDGEQFRFEKANDESTLVTVHGASRRLTDPRDLTAMASRGILAAWTT